MREQCRLPRNGGERVLRERDEKLALEHLARDWVRRVNGARRQIDVEPADAPIAERIGSLHS